MTGIIFDSGKIKVYENLCALCRYAGESQQWCDLLWQELLLDAQLYEEFLFFLKNGTLNDKMNCCGYTMIDLFIWQMDKYNLLHDTGKNTAECKKVDMVLRAFETMAQMKKDPETFLKRFDEGRGMDQL
ncbi:MAG: hypothetical protein IJ390_03930 [Lachnospiraceae bacterium]|nr:hypothetical protein [Lachnospiraceae bacterium]